jgi:putative PEP-CTERM system TPR-repeat lipoprotein
VRKVSNGVLMSAMCAMVLVGATGCGPNSPDELVESAKTHIAKQDHKSAIVELKSAIQKSPEDAEARLLLGRAYLETGDYASADKELTKARELGAPSDQLAPLQARLLLVMGANARLIEEIKPSPTLGPASLATIHAYRARAHLALGNREAAAKDLAEAERSDPQQPAYLLAKAIMAREAGQPGQAMSLVDAALARDKTLRDALYFKANLLMSEGKDAEALAVYRQITAVNPGEYLAHLAIAKLLMKQGGEKGAEDALKQADAALKAAEAAAPGSPVVKYSRAVFEYSRGHLSEANNAILQVLKLSPDHLPSLLIQAMISEGLGNYEQSRRSAERVWAQLPDNVDAARLVASARLRSNDIKGAEEIIPPLLKKHPNDIKVLALAAELHMRKREYDKAMALLEQASALQPDSARLLDLRVSVHLAQGEVDQAMTELRQAARTGQTQGKADLTLTLLHMQRKEFDQALAQTETLAKLFPDNPVIFQLRAAAHLGKQDRKAAREALQQALSLKPDFFPAALSLARLDLDEKNPAAARKRFESILAQDKNNIRAMLALADLAAGQGDEKESVQWLEKAARADVKAYAPRARLVQHHLANKRTKEALEIANSLAQTSPDSAEAMALLASAQLAAGDAASSISSLEKALRLAPEAPELLYRLGLAQLAAKRTREARSSLEKALAADRGHVRALDALIQLDLQDNKPDAALARIRQVQARFPDSHIAYDREGAVHMAQGKPSLAIQAYRQALARGAQTGTMIMLHRALLATGNTTQADQELNRWLGTHPRDRAAQAYYAEYKMLSGQDRAAIAQYEALLRDTPDNPILLNNLAVLYQRTGDSRALATAQRALELAPKSATVLDTVGWILVSQNQAAKGLDLIRQALDKVPESDTIRYHYAVALAQTGQRDKARQELSRLLQSKRNFPELQEARALLDKL